VIRKATREHCLNEDRIFGSGQLITVEMSSAQYAELLTTMNIGTGIPCTIKHIAGAGRVEDPPDDEIEIDRVQDSFKSKLKGMVSWIKEQRAEMVEILEKKTLSKANKAKIDWVLQKVQQEVECNMPFVVDQFNEASERMVTAAKAEVDAFVTHAVVKTGLTELQKLSGEPAKVLEITSGKPEDEE